MKNFLLLTCLVMISVMLAGCNLPGEIQPTEDIVATRVAEMLTETAAQASILPTATTAPTMTIPEPTVEATPTPTNTATETPTATEDLQDPAQFLGSPAWAYDFSESTSPWDNVDTAQATFKTANGYLNLTARTNANWHSWYVTSPRLRNAYLEATIEMTTCSGKDRFGLVSRSSSDGQQFYFLMITCDGQWGFFRMAPDVQINQIVGFQSAEPLKDVGNDPLRLGIWMEGSNFKFYIDGEEVGTATDATLTNEGYTGFLIAFANTSGFTVRVDELQYWNLP